MTDELSRDPEMESEAQAIANHEDELRELAEEEQAQDEDFEANKYLYEGAMKHIDEETAKEVAQYQEWNRKWEILKEYNIDMFRYWEPYDVEYDPGLSVVECLEYGSILTNLRIVINKYKYWGYTLFIHTRDPKLCSFDIQRNVDDYMDWIKELNKLAPLVYNVSKWNI